MRVVMLVVEQVEFWSSRQIKALKLVKLGHYQTPCKLTDECVPETPPVTKKQNQHAQTLNEILAKYNKKTNGM